MSFGDKKVIIATHVYATGPAQDLREYLVNNKVSRLLFIGHPLFFDPRLKGSGYEYYESGGKVREKYGKIRRIPALLSYLKDACFNIRWGILVGDKWDLYVGVNNLNALGGILLRLIGRVDRVVYYVIDYNPNRFSKPLMNKIYHAIDHFCVRYSDETWNLSPRMKSARKEYFGFEGGSQKVAPLGVWFSRINRATTDGFHDYTLVFMGHLLKQQGVQHVIHAMPDILKIIPDFKFVVIGGGEYLAPLKNIAKGLDLENSIQFFGYIENHEEIERQISVCAAAVALYEETDGRGNPSFTYFTDPGKVKAYLACGLPVLLSDVAHNARDIEARRCGMVIKNDPQSISRAVVELMTDMKKLAEYRANAVSYARQYDWNTIFEDLLSGVLNK